MSQNIRHLAGTKLEIRPTMPPNIEENDQILPERQSFKLGVLAIQGAFAEHVEALDKTVQQYGKNQRFNIVEIRKAEDFNDLDGLVIPGGESTTLNVFFALKDGLFERLRSWAKGEDENGAGGGGGGRRRRRVIFGTCAGLIFLSDRLDQQKLGGQLKLGGLNVTTRRNFFGRQRQSFQQDVDLKSTSISGESNTYPGVFIRAPAIASIGDDVDILATVRHDDGDVITAVHKEDRDANLSMVATAFHPELTADLRFHKFFLNLVAARTN